MSKHKNVLLAIGATALAFVPGGLPFSWGAFAKLAAVNGGLTLLSNVMARRAEKSAQRTAHDSLLNRRAVIQSTVSPRTITYGIDRVGGTIAFAGNTTISNKGYLFLVLILANNQSDGIEKVWFGDRDSSELEQYGDKLELMYGGGIGNYTANIEGHIYQNSSSTLANLSNLINANGIYSTTTDGVVLRISRVNGTAPFIHVSGSYTQDPEFGGLTYQAAIKHRIWDMWFHNGAENQTAPQELVDYFPNEFSSSTRGRGICYAVFRLRQDANAWKEGVPAINVLLKGKNDIFDSRNGTTGWTDNPALIIADYLKYGLNVPSDKINSFAVNNDANTCDQLVYDLFNAPHARYKLNGTIDLSQTPFDILDQMRLAYAGDIQKIDDMWSTRAGIARPATFTITEDDIVGDFGVKIFPSRKDIFNAVNGIYVEPLQNYTAQTYPTVRGATYVANDGGELPRKQDFQLVNSAFQAQRIASIILNRARQFIAIQLTLRPRALSITDGDICWVNIEHYGFINKQFEVASTSIQEDLSIQVNLVEYDAMAFSPNGNDLSYIDFAPNTSLQNPFNVSTPQNVQAVSGTDTLIFLNGTVQPRVRLTWNEASDAFVINGGRVIVSRKLTGTNQVEWLATLASDATEYYVDTVKSGQTWDFHVQFVNRYGRSGEWGLNIGHTVKGKELPPSDIVDFRIDVQPDGTREFTITPVSDIDVINGGGYELRYIIGTGGTWEQMSVLNSGVLTSFPYETNQLGAGLYVFAAKAIDSSGNYSLNANYIYAEIPDPRFASALMHRQEHLDRWKYAIITDGVINNDNNPSIVAAGQYTWDSIDSWDSWNTWEENPVSSFVVEAPVQFFNAITSFRPIVSATVKNGTAETQYRTKLAFADPWSDWTNTGPSNTSALYWQARVVITADPVGSIAEISKFIWIADAKLVEETISDSNTSTWTKDGIGYFVPITKAFSVISRINVSLQNVGPGWSWEVTTKNNLQPKIKIYNGSTLADALVDVTVFGLPN
jgi:hypothetical protein